MCAQLYRDLELMVSVAVVLSLLTANLVEKTINSQEMMSPSGYDVVLGGNKHRYEGGRLYIQRWFLSDSGIIFHQDHNFIDQNGLILRELKIENAE